MKYSLVHLIMKETPSSLALKITLAESGRMPTLLKA